MFSCTWQWQQKLTNDVTMKVMCTLLAVIQMGHDEWDTLKDYWSTIEHFYT
jgi:hypothetical protein